MTEKEFERYLDEVFETVVSYEARFESGSFEIGLLVSQNACRLFDRFGYVPHMIVDDPFNSESYLFGHRIAFVDSGSIPIVGGGELLIHPVVICNEIGVFPMQSELGDYIYFNGRLIQITGVDLINGSRSFRIEDIDVELSDRPNIAYDEWSEQIFYKVRDLESRKQKNDNLDKCVDTSAIQDYLSSIAIIQ